MNLRTNKAKEMESLLFVDNNLLDFEESREKETSRVKYPF